MSVHLKLFVAPAIAIAMLLLFAAMSMVALDRQSEALAELHQTRFSRYELSARTAHTIASAHASIHRIMTWRETLGDARLATASSAELQRLQDAANELDTFALTVQRDTPEGRLSTQIQSLLGEYRRHTHGALSAAGTDLGEAMLGMTRAEDTFGKLAATLAELVRLQEQLGQETFDSARATESRTVTAAWALLAFALILSVGTSLLMSRRIVGPLKAATAVAARVAMGDLRTVTVPDGNDETTELMLSLKAMQECLRQIALQVTETSSALAGAASQLATSTQEIERGSQEQSSAAQATAAAVEELSASIASVAQSAGRVASLSNESHTQARAGTQNLTAVSGEIDAMRSAVTEISSSVTQFVDSTRTIDGMTRQVTDLAEQTNLLALNAAIEAARAGEQGRGFAVVADEVRKLAERSAAAARQITTVTQSLQDGSGRVDTALKRGTDSIESSQQHMSAVADVIGLGDRMATETSEGVDDIHRSVREQTAATADIARNVEAIARMADDNARAVMVTASAARNLNEIAQTLTASVGHLRMR
jgi:methyl-accepting chemotaxis protein